MSQYGDAIMDAESDGFPGLVASEISADAEAAALTEQFAVTVRHATSQGFFESVAMHVKPPRFVSLAADWYAAGHPAVSHPGGRNHRGPAKDGGGGWGAARENAAAH